MSKNLKTVLRNIDTMANRFPEDIEHLRINTKPALDFDKKYGTKLSTEWFNFPRNLSSDMLWDIFTSTGYFDSQLYREISNELSFEHFPYKNIELLTINQKYHILQGMVSGFNYDDIVNYSIKGIYGYMNTDVVNTIIKLYGNIVERDVQWVMSPQTLNKLKKELVW